MATYPEWQLVLLRELINTKQEYIDFDKTLDENGVKLVSQGIVHDFFKELRNEKHVSGGNRQSVRLTVSGRRFVHEILADAGEMSPINENEESIESSKKLEDQPLSQNDEEHLESIGFEAHLKKKATNQRKLVREALAKDRIKQVLQEEEFYLQNAVNKFWELRNFPMDADSISVGEKVESFYEVARNRLESFYKKTKGEGIYGRFLDQLEYATEKQLFTLIGELIAYLDSKAYNKNEWNTYVDKRVVARAGIRQNVWASNLLNYKASDFDIAQFNSSGVRNAIQFLLNPHDTLTILSERHRELIATNFLEIEYDAGTFTSNVSVFFKYFQIKCVNEENLYETYSRVFYDSEIRKIWDVKAGEDDEPNEPEISPEYDHNADIIADTIAKEDDLGRKDLMEIVHNKVEKLWTDLREDQSFTILLNGEWGSGKSSMLYYLEGFLKKNKWTVVQYNAWQNQRFEEPWWILVNKVSKEVPKEATDAKNQYSSISHRYWKSKLQYSIAYIGAFVTSVLIVIGLANNLFGDSDNVAFYGSILALLGSLWVSVNGALQNIFKKKSFSALQIKNANDPLEPYKKRFADVVKHKKIAIFIDDLDRCEVEATVKLLEGIQTLFKESKVLYVIAADGHWVSDCFDDKYTKFSGLVPNGQTIGNQFLQKTFQLIVDVPKLSRKQQDLLLKKYLGRADEAEITETDEEEIEVEISQTKTVRGLSEAAAKGGAKARKRAAEKAEEIIEEQKEHYIQQLIEQDLVPANPRQMKRLINLFTLKIQELLISGVLGEVGEENVLRYILFSTEFPEYNYAVQNKAEQDFAKGHKEIMKDLGDLTPDLIKEYL
ncbi:MAG: P-loop NTPase fold protein [Cyclobacteriaceae bacterium]